MAKNLEGKLKQKEKPEEKIPSVLEHSTRIDVAKYSAFLAKHCRCAPNPGAPREAVQSDYSYIYTPTSVGTQVEVICRHCKKKEDVTNYDCW